MKDSDQCFTPPQIFETLRLKFDIDVAAPSGGVVWIPAKRFFTEEDDGLAQKWIGRVWMNPPFSQATPWVQKFIEHRNGIALLHMAKSAWFTELWESGAKIALAGTRLYFQKHGAKHQIFTACVLCAFGKACENAIARLGVVR